VKTLGLLGCNGGPAAGGMRHGAGGSLTETGRIQERHIAIGHA